LGHSYEIEVYNDGRPLTGEETAKLFKRFSRLTQADGRKTRGSGLGLFITKDIIEKHGGSIRVEPRENGNSFVFQIKKVTSDK
jgi:signal transduction histidine kinase